MRFSERQGVGPAVFNLATVQDRPFAETAIACRYNCSLMIAHLRGKLLSKQPNQVVVETAGVGYEVNISVPSFSGLPAIDREVALYIYTHVREDVIALYGFLQPAEKKLFEKLLSVSGIGAKLAITILSGMPADEMVEAIRRNDLVRLTKIPGIGRKTAERMVLELRDKLPASAPSSQVVAPNLSTVDDDVLSALVNLGYQRAAAEKALGDVHASKDHVSKDDKDKGADNFDITFRAALARLNK